MKHALAKPGIEWLKKNEVSIKKEMETLKAAQATLSLRSAANRLQLNTILMHLTNESATLSELQWQYVTSEIFRISELSEAERREKVLVVGTFINTCSSVL